MFLNSEGRKLPCEKLAIIYRKPSERQTQAEEQDDGNGGVISGSPVNQRIRKISRSISIENNLMQQINLLAVVPALWKNKSKCIYLLTTWLLISN